MPKCLAVLVYLFAYDNSNPNEELLLNFKKLNFGPDEDCHVI